jgi:YD repeat-containing protein
MSIGKLTAVSTAGGQTLAVTWDDGRTAQVDLAGVIAARKALAPLGDAAAFASATLSAEGWSVECPCAVDFGAPQLRRWADEQSGEVMAAAAFRTWMESHAFTLDRAADALGLSRRMIAYYLSGEQPVPKTVMLATEGFDRRMAA